MGAAVRRSAWRRARGHGLGLLVGAGLLAIVFLGCGISLRAEQRESEIFRDLTIHGEPGAGQQLSFTLEYEQPYPVPIDIICDLVDATPKEDGQTATPTAAQTENVPAGEGDGDTIAVDEEEEREVISRILQETAPANPEGGPLDKATPVPHSVERAFFVPESPGRYVVLCYTEEDDDNAIGQLIVVEPEATAAPPTS